MEPGPTNRQSPVSAANEAPVLELATKEPEHAMSCASRNVAPKTKKRERPRQPFGQTAAEAKGPSSQSQSNEEKKPEEAKKRSTTTKRPESMTACRPKLVNAGRDAPAAAVKTDAVEVLQGPPQLKVIYATDAPRQYRQPSPTLRQPSMRPENEPGTAVIHCPRNTVMAFQRPPRPAHQPTTNAAVEADGRCFDLNEPVQTGHKEMPPEYNNVIKTYPQNAPYSRKSSCEAMEVFKVQGLDLQAPRGKEQTKAETVVPREPSPPNKPENCVAPPAVSVGVPGLTRQSRNSIIASRAGLAKMPVPELLGTRSSLSRRAFFAGSLEDLTSVASRSTSTLKPLGEDIGVRRGNPLGRRPHFPDHEDFQIPVRRPPFYAAAVRDAGSAVHAKPSRRYKRDVTVMTDIGSLSHPGDAPRRVAASLLDGEQVIALKRTACVCGTVALVTTALLIGTYLTVYGQLRAPSTLKRQMSEADEYDLNRSDTFLQTPFDRDERSAPTTTNYNGVETFPLTGGERDATDAPHERGVFIEG